MQRFSSLLLDVWREVGRHIEIGESVERVAAILRRRVPLACVLVRHLEVQRSCLETVGAGFCSPARPAELRTKSECSAAALEQILRWCRRGEVLRGTAADLGRQFPGLLPSGLDGDILAGPLSIEEGPAGVLILSAASDGEFVKDHEDLLQALLEPFVVAMENDRRVRELTALRDALEADKQSLLSRLDRHDISDTIVGAESGLKAVMEQIDLVARAQAPVLILGETGSGKEVVARAIHSRSTRASKPFLRVNCGAIPAELIDSELFGHERGSFTGATGARMGWFERADSGTLFLDECGELPPAAQVRLLRILQDGTFERVGAEKHLTVDVRIIAATHRDLHDMVAQGSFRQDLWYRIAVFPIRLPPLRERVSDIPALAAHFALRAAKRLGTMPLVPSPADIQLLIGYSWPGNARELAAVIERAAILGEGKRLEIGQALGVTAPRAVPAQTPAEPVVPLAPTSTVVTLDHAMVRHIEAALTKTHGRIEGHFGAAKLLQINPHTLRARMRKLGIDWRQYRKL